MPDDQVSARLHGLLHEIWLYLWANPRSKDTVEGIHDWWINNGKQRFTKDEVQQALDFTVERGWMQQSYLGPTVLYSTTIASLKEFNRALDEPHGSNAREE